MLRCDPAWTCHLVSQQGIILVDYHKASPVEWVEGLGFAHLTLVHRQAVTAQGEASSAAGVEVPGGQHRGLGWRWHATATPATQRQPHPEAVRRRPPDLPPCRVRDRLVLGVCSACSTPLTGHAHHGPGLVRSVSKAQAGNRWGAVNHPW